ncbi:hypothetical protein [Halioxenophilus sp. WMMB6]|uniref:hypothetical protein n=1 Tax=Halioxenophilus sp. WMMB6 TaxID=3073815 RepID=UPI00295E29F0|nr:hypothetical protein [Halioxenophilus sp. WMMB6]
MKKLLLAVLFLSGCQTAGQLGTMSQSGMAALSCDQIYGAFNAYQRDRDSMDAWVQLVKVVSPSADPYAVAAGTTADQRYEQAVAYANIALVVQQCPTL